MKSAQRAYGTIISPVICLAGRKRERKKNGIVEFILINTFDAFSLNTNARVLTHIAPASSVLLLIYFL